MVVEPELLLLLLVLLLLLLLRRRHRRQQQVSPALLLPPPPLPPDPQAQAGCWRASPWVGQSSQDGTTHCIAVCTRNLMGLGACAVKVLSR